MSARDDVNARTLQRRRVDRVEPAAACLAVVRRRGCLHVSREGRRRERATTTSWAWFFDVPTGRWGEDYRLKVIESVRPVRAIEVRFRNCLRPNRPTDPATRT